MFELLALIPHKTLTIIQTVSNFVHPLQFCVEKSLSKCSTLRLLHCHDIGKWMAITLSHFFSLPCLLLMQIKRCCSCCCCRNFFNLISYFWNIVEKLLACFFKLKIRAWMGSITLRMKLRMNVRFNVNDTHYIIFYPNFPKG